MTADEVRSILRGVGVCGESNGKLACLLPPDHVGPHGYELGMCEWHECPQQADTTRTDIGGTTFALCREHERDGEAAGYWRSV
jgi:hypothetical protein